MYKIEKHPILDIPQSEVVEFLFEGQKVQGRKGYTIAKALHEAGFPVHSHSLQGRNRSLECGIGKCGACEMLVDGRVRRICITPVDNVKEVRVIAHEADLPGVTFEAPAKSQEENVLTIYKTTVAIVGAGPAMASSIFSSISFRLAHNRRGSTVKTGSSSRARYHSKN